MKTRREKLYADISFEILIRLPQNICKKFMDFALCFDDSGYGPLPPILQKGNFLVPLCNRCGNTRELKQTQQQSAG